MLVSDWGHSTCLTLLEAISLSFRAQTALPTLLGHVINMHHLYKESKVKEMGHMSQFHHRTHNINLQQIPPHPQDSIQALPLLGSLSNFPVCLYNTNPNYITNYTVLQFLICLLH